MSRFWSPLVGQLTPYVPGEQPKMANLVKLNTNENPYGPSPQVIAAIQAETADVLRMYPDPGSEKLREGIARYHSLSAEQIFVGNGSDEVLAHVFLGLLRHERPIFFPDITYSFYPVYCGLYGVSYKTIPLAPDMSINIDDYAPSCAGIIFPNPNAPTGKLLALAQLQTLLERHPDAVVVVDEAYIDFGGSDDPASIPSAISLIARFPNLLVVQTLSKSRSLAGLRVGFAAGHPDLIEALNRVKDSFNSYPLDRLAQAGAAASYADQDYFAATRRKVMHSRTRLSEGLQALGFDVIPSSANFVFAQHPQHDARKSALALRRLGIIVRHFNSPRIENYLRITVGTDAQCDCLLNALTDLVA
jgi:histidinol-phosphate aminotransferase